MPRRPRLLIPGMPLHIVQRGHNRQPCFHEESDYLVYLERLRKHAQDTGCAVHAYVLMTNHVHLLLSFEEVRRAPELVKLLAQQYGAYLNKRLMRSGSVWEGRYWSWPINTERYLLVCQRYIELNPVEATMVASQEGYRWSSYAGNAGLIEDTLLSPHALYLRLGATAEERHANYCLAFGDENNAQQIAEMKQAMKQNAKPGEAVRSVGRPRKNRRQ